MYLSPDLKYPRKVLDSYPWTSRYWMGFPPRKSSIWTVKMAAEPLSSWVQASPAPEKPQIRSMLILLLISSQQSYCTSTQRDTFCVWRTPTLRTRWVRRSIRAGAAVGQITADAFIHATFILFLGTHTLVQQRVSGLHQILFIGKCCFHDQSCWLNGQEVNTKKQTTQLLAFLFASRLNPKKWPSQTLCLLSILICRTNL